MKPAHEYPGVPFDTIADAQKWLRNASRTSEGAICPCCTQKVKVYPRMINATMVYVLIRLYHADCRKPDGFHRLTDLMKDAPFQWGGDYGKLAYWNLIEQAKGRREDGSSRNGYWKITQRGIDFISGLIVVPKYAYVFNGNALSYSDDQIGVTDALDERFNYDELMQAV